jgi:antirestriction protein ArdC
MRADELIEQVTNDMIAAIETGADTWQMPWHTIATTAQPHSIDHRPYRGLNAVVLSLTAAANGWPTGTWATYNGWQRHGAQVRRGERCTHVLLWKPARPVTEHDRPTSEADDTDTSAAPRGRLVSRVFAVFAAEQVDGANLPTVDSDQKRDTPERIAAADTYFASIGADVTVGGNRACYIPADDRIHVPDLSQFEQPALFYSTTCHEHIHWTAHPTRLARDLSGRFGDDAYAVEELIAELGAAFWCAQAALTPAARTDHANYLAHWVRVLREQPRVLLTVAARAQAALDYLNQLASVTNDTAAIAIERAS